MPNFNQVTSTSTFNEWRLTTNELVDWLNSESTNNNYAGDGPPGISDDATAGYDVGSIWLDITSNPNEGYRCLDNTDGAAVWLNTTLEIGDLGSMAIQDANSVNISGGAITNITDITVADGGTGGSTAGEARTNLSLYSQAEIDAISVANRLYSEQVAAENAVALSIALG